MDNPYQYNGKTTLDVSVPVFPSISVTVFILTMASLIGYVTIGASTRTIDVASADSWLFLIFFFSLPFGLSAALSVIAFWFTEHTYLTVFYKMLKAFCWFFTILFAGLFALILLSR